MFIEVMHDEEGTIQGCYCVDTLPGELASPLFFMDNMPLGWTQARVNIDTLTLMEVEAACRERAVIDPVSGAAGIVSADRAKYIVDNFTVDLSMEYAVPAGVELPAGFNVRGLLRVRGVGRA
jgi:hypothetical protein